MHNENANLLASKITSAARDTTPLLETCHMSYTYQGKHPKIVLEGLSLSFQAGTFYAIVGPSGSGKTTLLSILAGLDTPSAGTLAFKGVSVLPKGLARYRQRAVSLVFQSYNLIDYLTPSENVRLGGDCNSEEVLNKVGIDECDFKRSVLKLSGGQQQRVAIARALARQAEILLADEPTGNLDEDTASGIIDILEQCARENNTCVIVVTHSPQLAKRADVVIDLGEINRKIQQ